MIEFERVTKRFGSWTAVDAVSFTVAEGEFRVLIGPSGSGKSTVLRMINRLIPADEGAIRIDGEDIASLKPEELRRRMGYVIQSVGLFPHWTVERNIATVPGLLGWPKARIRDRVTELLELLNLDPRRYRSAYPHQLSGGQQQRVGVARALAAEPRILLMDEPFSALDPITRASLQTELSAIHRRTGTTVVFVTHDMDEALRLGDSIAVMDHGRLIQCASPLDILTRPASPLVRDLVGREEWGLKRLAVETVGDRARRQESAAGEPLAAETPLHRALSEMVARGTERLPVVDGDGRPAGVLHLSDLVRPSTGGTA
ncbi:ABC transporter ATP-binding protein (plasmid) [Azospirillum oryzae]|uniref:ABC transporter ATP-binding protein n=1 Tax=Azospirillum oryzae TaxID=286727 RepID=A0A6N1ADY3_9PROT|nr:ABC transporter ATP-binding protein [Azospirillum oryzae]KAA0588347.1 ABC transporter ATP-binding protein [Azospirillum oryzae]QKS49389.1 ABC transporter ATP-binding protein [Azospirillum oryzae]GLR78310.1 ABC transporter ATP-binding protein [Azospirillum oryzae]